MENITQSILDFIYEIKTETVPDDIEHFTKDCLLDYLGVTYAGAYELRDKANLYFTMSKHNRGEISLIGANAKVTEYDAALFLGMSAHYFDLDDGSRFGMLHPGAPVFSALLAATQTHSVSGKAFIRAVVTGYETAVRLACAIQPDHKKRGFHATGTCGCVGAAAAVAVALNFDEVQIANTLSAAVASASGLLEMTSDTSQLKPFNVGKAAQNAIISAYIGASGFVGPKDSVGGKRGFLGTMADTFRNEYFDRAHIGKYIITSIYRKPYASCRHCHPSVEAALELNREFGINSESIESIKIQTYNLAILGHDHTTIDGVDSAKMSIPYSVAAALVLNDGGIEGLSEAAIHNQRILALTQKVRVTENTKYSKLVPAKRIANMTVRLSNGTIYEKKVIYPKGEPENPMTHDEVVEKFMRLTSYSGMNATMQNKLIECVYEPDFSVKKLFKIISEGNEL